MRKLLGLKNLNELFVLAASNDPYGKGRASHEQQTTWFADLWEERGFTSGVRLRRFHYWALVVNRADYERSIPQLNDSSLLTVAFTV
jgi:hypothetical protein